MKIGILTLHAQLNYGGILQAFALFEVLRELGHSPVIVDRWLSPNNELLRPLVKLGLWEWVRVVVRELLGARILSLLSRRAKTICFLSRNLKFTNIHFHEWKEVSSPLGVDLLVVGSDQVWHCGDWGAPEVYLLEGAEVVPAVSYAASFGMTSLPNGYYDLFRRGLGRFSALSCREESGVEICRQLGFPAQCVLDPTLLVRREIWDALLGEPSRSNPKGGRRRLVCYFMTVDADSALPLLTRFAQRENVAVEVFVNSPVKRCGMQSVGNRFAEMLATIKGIRFRLSAGPEEFIKGVAAADFVLTDSFHALMFSAIFEKNIRVLRPTNVGRVAMFSRIGGFVARYVSSGEVIQEGIAEALDSFVSSPRIVFDFASINEARRESRSWLCSALQTVSEPL